MNKSFSPKVCSTLFRTLATVITILLIPVFFQGCSAKVNLPVLSPLPPGNAMNIRSVQSYLKHGPPKSPANTIKKIDFPKNVRMPMAGEKNAYGIYVTPELELAYNTYLGGDGEKALGALISAEKKGGDAGFLWQISFLKVQIMIMMGRAADAEEELVKTSEREIAFIGNNLNSRALSGEVNVWAGDYDKARSDFVAVLKALGSWSFPTSYSLPPSNMAELVGTTTAQLRALTGLTGIYVLEENYPEAMKWALETEKRFNDVHYVSHHPLYKMSIKVHADSYYGRALNLVFLAASHLVVTKKMEESETMYQNAGRFFDALDYKTGSVNIAAFRARTLNKIGRYDLCNTAGKEAIDLALKYGMSDMIWRIEILRGKTFLKLGLHTRAEAAFRRAQTCLDDISGALSTDHAKVRFGVGKEDISYHLSRINMQKKDYTRLFEDLERGRARAFVDMLAGRVVGQGRQSKLVKRIKQLDQQIIRHRLLNTSPGEAYKKAGKKEKRLLSKRRKTLKTLRKRDAELADALSISSKSLSDIQRSLNQGESLVYALPFKQNDSLKLFLIQSARVKIISLPITARTLQNRIKLFTSLATDHSNGLDSYYQRGLFLKKQVSTTKPVSSSDLNIGKQKAIAKQLSKEMKLNQWNSERTVFFVPSGPFYFLPWGALNTLSPVVVLPNGGWLLRKHKKTKHPNKAIVVGNPSFGNMLPQLPGAENEAKQVAHIYETPPLILDNATETKIRKNIGNGVHTFHLATHAVYNENEPLESAVFLTKAGKAAALTAKDIFRNPIPAQLVVLSACETGVAKVQAGDDFLGLARSFYIGGTQAILTSLWPVEDHATNLFMTHFHETAKTGAIGDAWLTARDHLKKLGYPPSIYSAFVLGGASTL